jgi:carbon storage regulator
MLVLTRKAGEKVQIGDQIEITILRIGPEAVRIGIDAPPDLNIVRTELIGHATPATDTPMTEQPLCTA